MRSSFKSRQSGSAGRERPGRSNASGGVAATPFVAMNWSIRVRISAILMSAAAVVASEIIGKGHAIAIDVADAAHQPNTSIVQHRQIERRMIWPANQLKRRLMTRTFDVVNGAGALAQHAEPIQPPKDVMSAVASGQTRMTADGERHLPPGALNLVGKLHAGRGSANDEYPAGRQLFGTPVIRRYRFAGPTAPDDRLTAGTAGRSQYPVATTTRRRPPDTAIRRDTETIDRSLYALHRPYR